MIASTGIAPIGRLSPTLQWSGAKRRIKDSNLLELIEEEELGTSRTHGLPPVATLLEQNLDH